MHLDAASDASPLPAIPLLDVPSGSEPAVVSALAEPARLALLTRSARRAYTVPGMTLANHLSRAWANRSAGPYARAVAAIDGLMPGRGGYLLNHAYEWGCTTAAIERPQAREVALLRTLDWPFHGLGSALVATRWDGGAGPYVSLTWPGFVGVLTGLAPGRFAAAINQPPLPLPGWGKAIGWSAARFQVWSSRALPPSHLLRLAFDTCASFSQAVELIAQTPICLPAIFTVAGIRPGEAVVIERTEIAAFFPSQAAAANHWASRPGPIGRPRNRSSRPRREALLALDGRDLAWSLEWLRAPVLQYDTRVVAMASAAHGRLLAQGLERSGPVTAVLELG